MKKIEFNASFRTDRAGRDANQDNGFVLTDILTPENGAKAVNTDRTITPGAYGSLFVIADGMGGMNAGEKASELVKSGMMNAFSNVPKDVPGNIEHMTSFLVGAIKQADEGIKAYARSDSHTRGMGSTIVVLWILGDTAVCAWVGDSRIYRFNPANGLVRLSHDHSYVQSLVDSGRLPAHMAHDHPDSNIITRSLGDNGEPARPQTAIYRVYEGDEFLLCSDGLCGLLTDADIEKAMRTHIGSSKDTLEALWAEGERQGWSDNATIEVVCVSGELFEPTATPDGYDTPDAAVADFMQTTHRPPVIQPSEITEDMRKAKTSGIPSMPANIAQGRKSGNSTKWIVVAAIVIVAAVIVGSIVINRSFKEAGEREEQIERQLYTDPNNYHGSTFHESKDEQTSKEVPIEAPVRNEPQKEVSPKPEQNETPEEEPKPEAQTTTPAASNPGITGPELPKEEP